MKINETEQLVGITKKNIRFYEQEGLIRPGRNLENGYRDYGEEDVKQLKKIKLLRKLSVPIEEIRRIQAGVLTLEDAMRRHIIALERESRSLEQMRQLCTELAEKAESYEQVDPSAYLDQMDQMEKEGMRFMDVNQNDRRKKMVAPSIVAVLFIGLLLGLMWLLWWAKFTYVQDSPPMFVMALLTVVLAAPAVGILLALRARMKEIRGGEEDAARKY